MSSVEPVRIRGPEGGSALVLILFLSAVLPAALQNLAGERAQMVVVGFQVTSPAANGAGSLIRGLLLAGIALLFVSNPLRLRVPWRLKVCLLPWAALVGSALIVERRVEPASVVFIAAVSLATVADRRRTLSMIGALTVLTAVGCLALAVLVPTYVFVDTVASAPKGFLGGRLLAGPFHHPNQLGSMMALGLPFVTMMRHCRGVGVASALLVLVLTGSRTAMLTVAVGALFALVWRYRRRPGQPVVLGPALLTVAAVGVVVPLTAGSGAFTGRGRIWERSIASWSETPVFGSGPGFYSRAALTADMPNAAFHAHNMFVQFLTIGGLVAAVAFLTLMWHLIASASRWGKARELALAAWPIMFLVNGWLEMPTDFFAPGSLAWVTWMPLALSLRGRRSDPVDLRPPRADRVRHAARDADDPKGRDVGRRNDRREADV